MQMQLECVIFLYSLNVHLIIAYIVKFCSISDFLHKKCNLCMYKLHDTSKKELQYTLVALGF